MAKGQLYVSIELFWNRLLKDALSKVSILTIVGGDVVSHKSSCFLMTNSGEFVSRDQFCNNLNYHMCQKSYYMCKTLLGASLILFDLT